jgi:hypothetical protein
MESVIYESRTSIRPALPLMVVLIPLELLGLLALTNPETRGSRRSWPGVPRRVRGARSRELSSASPRRGATAQERIKVRFRGGGT